mgnify:FL=1
MNKVIMYNKGYSEKCEYCEYLTPICKKTKFYIKLHHNTSHKEIPFKFVDSNYKSKTKQEVCNINKYKDSENKIINKIKLSSEYPVKFKI